MSTKTALLVAQLFDGRQHVRNVITNGAHDVMHVFEGVPPRLTELDFDPEGSEHRTSMHSSWKLSGWGKADYIPLSEWILEHRTTPEIEHRVPRPSGDDLVIVQYIEYQRVSSS